MFFLIGRRYWWLSLIVGAVLLGIGVTTGDIRYDVTGCLGLAFGAIRGVAAWRRRGIGGQGGGAHIGGTLR